MIVIVDALRVKKTVEGSSVCVTFRTDGSADKVIMSELRKVVVMNSEVINVEAGSVFVSI